MEPVILILAAVGVSAVLVRLARTFLRLLERGSHAWLARETAGARQRRGDLTGLGEASALERTARAQARRAGLRFGFWLLVLLVPIFTPWTAEIYAACSLLWLTRARTRGGSLTAHGREDAR